jgi:uncharacterized protein YegJ (DUF2314 family)
MKLPEHYHTVASGEIEIPSWMAGVLPSGIEIPTVADVLAQIEASRLGLSFERVLPDPEMEDARWEIEIKAEPAGSESTKLLRVWVQPTYHFEEQHFDWTGLTQGEVETIRRSRWTIGVSCTYGDNPLVDYHLQLQVLATIAAEAVAMLDIAACRPHPRSWLLETAATAIPPSPSTLFCIHAVHDENRPHRGVWMHTHGLLRCGSIELEMLDIPHDEMGVLSELLITAATLFIDGGIPEPGRPFAAGAGIDLVWLPWEAGITRFSRRTLGTERDRDQPHCNPSGILFKPARKRFFGLVPGMLGSPVRYASVLKENPVLYVSSMETDRMSRLARERLAAFRDMLDRYGDIDDWLFLVKLGYEIDGAEDANECEHLWFEVHAMDQEQVDATLTNEPHHIAGMHEGDRSLHQLDRTTDWAILCPHGQFHPDTLVHLERALGGELTRPS